MGMVGQNPNQNDTQKRILIATMVAFLFFIAYDILYLQPKQKELAKTNQPVKQKQIKANNKNEITKTQTPSNISKVKTPFKWIMSF